jgi:C4-type Zn-finger protein
METKSQPKLREAALDRYAEQWANAIDQTEELQRTFQRLTEAMAQMAERGAHLTLVFEDDLTQKWWVAYREKQGDMVPRHPEEPPALMQHEDLIVLGRQAVQA